MSEDEQTITDYLKEIKGILKDKNKIKKARLPWKSRLGRRRVRSGWCSVMYVRNNKSVDFVRAPIEDMVVRVGDLYHTATPDDILIYKNKPMLLLTEWSIRPMTPWRPKEHFEEAVERDELTTPQRHILSKLEQGVIKAKKSLKLGGWIAVIIAAVVGVYFISQGGLSGG